MDPKQIRTIWLVIGFIIAGLTGFYSGKDSISVSTQQALFSDTGPFVAQLPTKNSQCVIQDSLPDPACTPGAIFSDVTVDKICVSGYTKTVRDVSVSLKKKIYRAYGVVYPPPFGTYELDHYIPLTLGGSNDIANLWPFPADPRPGFIEKDLTVNYLHREVCNGKISLSAAQRAITTTWVAVYNSIPQADKEELKRMFPTWARNQKPAQW
ncbi:MAG: HNH endonuclease [Candidatus Pacebacteria bacterium]|nr:HNH endonuclease [Candidatus Paceibacterota bacterium]